MTQPPNEIEAGNLVARESFKFRDEVSNIAASDDNPTKHGIFVRHLHGGMAEYVSAQGVHHTPLENLQAALASKPAAPTVEAKLQQCLKCGSEYWIDYSWNPAAPTAEKYTLDFRGDDCNVADDRDVIGKAIQTWSWHQQRPTSVAEAAQVFNIEPREVVDIIEHFDSPYLLLMGPTDDYTKLMIEHDGE